MATVLSSSLDLVALVRDGHREGPAWPVRLHQGRGRTRICVGWTGRSVIGLRAVSSGHAVESRTVALKVRPAPWMIGVHRLLARLPVSVSVAEGGALLFGDRGNVLRVPASDQKLLLSMALLDQFGPGYRIPTTAEGVLGAGGAVRGDLFLVGHGDPELGGTALDRLAQKLRSSGLRDVRGSVVGVTSTFTRGRWAPGWSHLALHYIGLPTALTFDANAGPGGFVLDPERRAAAALTSDLESLGIRVNGPPRAGPEPSAQSVLARVRSARLFEILRRQNVGSLNLYAEVLGKMLGATVLGPPGSIAKGARAIQSWAESHGVSVVAHDSSGLSYKDRITTDGVVLILGVAGTQPWGPAVRSSLPAPGHGTLAGRLAGLRVRAKTGTLIRRISALSGWVWLDRSHRWAEFSVLSRGLPKSQALGIEDTVVRIVAKQA